MLFCLVRHASLTRPEVFDWTSASLEFDRTTRALRRPARRVPAGRAMAPAGFDSRHSLHLWPEAVGTDEQRVVGGTWNIYEFRYRRDRADRARGSGHAGKMCAVQRARQYRRRHCVVSLRTPVAPM